MMGGLQMGAIGSASGSMSQKTSISESATAQASMQKQQQSKLHAQASSTQQSEELEDQEFFVPLRQIGRVQKNALAEASAMAKMKDDHFELVINIQKFTPEEVKVYVEGQAVLVTAKKCTSRRICHRHLRK